jgi:hypothetical protein
LALFVEVEVETRLWSRSRITVAPGAEEGVELPVLELRHDVILG